MNEEEIKKGKKKIKELADILKKISDSEVDKLLGTGAMDNLLKAILDPSKRKKDQSIAEFLIENKMRASHLALLRHVITNNYSFKGTIEGQVRFVSPLYFQWFEDGVMFLEGKQPYGGFIGLYRDKELRFAIANKYIEEGEEMGREDFDFITMKEFNERLKKIPPKQISDLMEPIRRLTELLNNNVKEEDKYQEWFQKYPWVLGLQYDSVDYKTKLDDETIPDFTAVRAHDKHRDIVEIKSPFIDIFRKDGEFNSNFNDAWNQIERYITYARDNKDTLQRQKGLKFYNPKARLIIGYKIDEKGQKKIRKKEINYPAIEILTYEGLLEYIQSTIESIKNIQSKK